MLLSDYDSDDYLIYPTLVGLGFPLIKRCIFYNATARSGAGWNVRVSYAPTPTWEWDLTYDVLRDDAASDLQTLLNFYLALASVLEPFLFIDPDDNTVTGQPVGTTDGTTTNWTLQRTYGSGQTANENIGMVMLNSTIFNLYLDGSLQSNSTYDVYREIPGNQQVLFHTAPSAGQAITVDMSYYFFVRFKDPTNDFDKFADKFWQIKKITLKSLRG